MWAAPVRAVLATLVIAGTASSCTLFENATQPTDPEGLQIELERTLSGSAGGTVEAADVTVRVPPGASTSDLSITVHEPIPTDDHELAGPAIAVEHAAPINEALTLEFDISALTEAQRDTLLLVKWDEIAGDWLVENQPFLVDGDVLRTEISDWSAWDWWANVSQESQELFGRRKDPPACGGPVPDWVHDFVDPDAGTSSAPVLVCLDDDPNDESVVTMRIVSNRTVGQFIDLDAPDGWAWTWDGDLPTSVESGVYSAAAAVLGGTHHVFLPPLQEIAVGVRRPDQPGMSQFIGFETRIDAASLTVDAVRWMASQVNVGDAFDNPLMAVFFEVLIECGIADVGAAADAPLDDLARSVVSALAGCATSITTFDTEIGRQFRQRVSERIVAYGTPEAAATAIKANKILHSVASKLKYLTFFEFVGYLADVGLEARVGPWTWSMLADGEFRSPGAWTPTCTDVVADREAWSRAWVVQEVFQTPPLRDFHEYPEFEGVLRDASAPLTGCSRAHVDAVIAAIMGVGFQTPEAAEIAERVLSDIAARSGSTTGAANEADLTSCEGTDTSLIEGDFIPPVVCSFPWAIAEATTMLGDGPAVIVTLINTLDRQQVATWWNVEDGPAISGYTVDSIIGAGVTAPAAQLLFDTLDACAGCAYRNARPPSTAEGTSLRGTGIGGTDFGSDAEAAVATLVGQLGAPDDDSGWYDTGYDPTSADDQCQSPTMRILSWPNLNLVFADYDPASGAITGRRTFVYYAHFNYEGGESVPTLETERGVRLGSPAADATAGQPGARVYDSGVWTSDGVWIDFDGTGTVNRITAGTELCTA